MLGWGERSVVVRLTGGRRGEGPVLSMLELDEIDFKDFWLDVFVTLTAVSRVEGGAGVKVLLFRF